MICGKCFADSYMLILLILTDEGRKKMLTFYKSYFFVWIKTELPLNHGVQNVQRLAD